MLEYFKQFWYIWALIFAFSAFRRFMPQIVGWLGEQRVRYILSALPAEEYRRLYDIMLKTASGTTQIDHIVVSIYGIFVIETKNYRGWIFGNKKSNTWTQSVFDKRRQFFNPIKQNYGHIYAVKKLLAGYADISPVSIIAFSDGCRLKSVPSDANVVYFSQMLKAIKKYKDVLLTKNEMENIAAILERENITSASERRAHKDMVRKKAGEGNKKK